MPAVAVPAVRAEPRPVAGGQATFLAAMPTQRAVLQASETVRLDRPSISRPPREALPRRLHACMQELLSVNERYHELLQTSDAQCAELEAARAELGRLRPALAESEARLAAQSRACARAAAEGADLRAAHELQDARCSAAEAERDDLHKVVAAYAQRLLRSEKELQEARQTKDEAQAWLATHWQAGYEQGASQQQRDVKGKVRRAQQRNEAHVSEAFERGRAESAKAASAQLLREQAERRLLLHRAEEVRLQQRTATRRLEGERQAREAAEARTESLQERLRGVRSHKQSLSSELDAARAAHAADLDHFDDMEHALGYACAEYSSLAARHARACSPPRATAASRAGGGADGFGSSPPSAMRARPPRPAAVEPDPPQAWEPHDVPGNAGGATSATAVPAPAAAHPRPMSAHAGAGA